MGFHIYSSIVCNTVGFPSNKGEKSKKIKIESNKIAYRMDDIGIAVLKPTIDRIIFGFSLSAAFLKQFDPTEDLEEYAKKIKSDLFSSAKSAPDSHLSLVEGVNFKKKPYSAYNVHLHFKPPGAGHPILIQVDPKWPKNAFIRIDMKPSALDKAAIQAFRGLVEGFLILPGDKIPSYGDFLRWSKITHMELNVDILGARPHDMEVISLADKKPAPVKSHKYKGKTGRTETVYPKAKPGKSSTEYVYDKRQERLDAGVLPIHGNVLHTRVECRLEKQVFYKLAGHNRFGRISVRALVAKKFSALACSERLFARLALEQSLDRALKDIPDELKPQFKQTYNDVMVNIWDAKGLWEDWKREVASSAFLSLE